MPSFELPKFVYSNEHLLGVLSQLTELERPQWLNEINELMIDQPQKSFLLTFDEALLKNITYNGNVNNKLKPINNNHSTNGSNDGPSKYKSKKWGSFEFADQIRKDSNKMGNDGFGPKTPKDQTKSSYSFDESCIAELAPEVVAASVTNANTSANDSKLIKTLDNNSDSPSCLAWDKEPVASTDKKKLFQSKCAVDDSIEDTMPTSTPVTLPSATTSHDQSTKHTESRTTDKSGSNIKDFSDENVDDRPKVSPSIAQPTKPHHQNTTSPTQAIRKQHAKADQNKDENPHYRSNRARSTYDSNKKSNAQPHAVKNSYSSSYGSTSIVMGYNSNASMTTSSATNYRTHGNKKSDNSSVSSITGDKKVSSHPQPEQLLVPTKGRPLATLVTTATKQQRRPRPKSYNDGAADTVVNTKKVQSTQYSTESKEPILTIDEIMREQMAEKVAEEKKQKQLIQEKIRKKKEKESHVAQWLATTHGPAAVPYNKASETISIEQLELEEKAKSLSLNKGANSLENKSPNPMNNRTINSDGKFWDSAMKFF